MFFRVTRLRGAEKRVTAEVVTEELIHPRKASVAIDKNGNPFDPNGAFHWALYRETGGRPAAVRDEEGEQVMVEIDANRNDVRRAVSGQPGVYYLAAVDDLGEEMDYPRAEVELAPMDGGAWGLAPSLEIPARMCSMMESVADSFKTNNITLGDVTRELTKALTEQQRAQRRAPTGRKPDHQCRHRSGCPDPPVADAKGRGEPAGRGTGRAPRHRKW